MINEAMYLRRQSKVLVNLPKSNLDESLVEHKETLQFQLNGIATIAKNLEVYGYTLSKEILEVLKHSEYNSVIKWYFKIRDLLEVHTGATAHMKPLYPNFPETVMDSKDGQMYLDSLLYFLSNGTISPETAKERPELNELCKLQCLQLGSQEDFNSLLPMLLESKVSFGVAEQEDVAWFVDHTECIEQLFPQTFPNKENLASFTKLIIHRYGLESEQVKTLSSYYKIATDVLRLATSLSDGDVSLANKTMYKSFSKSERRTLLSLLESCKYLDEDMNRYKMQWIRLGERLHPGDFSKKFPKVFQAFTNLRQGVAPKSFYSKVETAFSTRNHEALIKLYSSRPGEFARNMDRLLVQAKTLDDGKAIVSAFESVAPTVESTVLISLYQHMLDRKTSFDLRAFFPKGNISKAYIIENNLKPIKTELIDETIRVCIDALSTKFAQKEALGTVYIDEELKDFAFPMVLRNASKTLKPMARGSKIKLKDTATTVRAFLYWKDPSGRNVDLDLSAIFYDKDFNLLNTCYYGNYDETRIKKYGAYHSGDVRRAPNGAAEFIDLELAKLKDKNVAYVAICSNSYSEVPYSELPECFVGVMEREKPKSGEIFEPSTVVNRSDLVNKQENSLAMVLDVNDRSFIWTDIGFESKYQLECCNNINTKQASILATTKAMITKNYISLYEVIRLNAMARGTVVTEKADADYIFSLEGYEAPEITETPVSQVEEGEEDSIEKKEPLHALITPYQVETLIAMCL